MAVPTRDAPVRVPQGHRGQLVALGVLLSLVLVTCGTGGLVLVMAVGRFFSACLPGFVPG